MYQCPAAQMYIVSSAIVGAQDMFDFSSFTKLFSKGETCPPPAVLVFSTSLPTLGIFRLVEMIL